MRPFGAHNGYLPGGTLPGALASGPLDLVRERHDLVGRVNRALGRLDGLAAMVPERELLADLVLRREAVLSLQIEGKAGAFRDIAAGRDDSGLFRALKHGLARVREGLPVSVRLIRQMHEIMHPEETGQFRRTELPCDDPRHAAPPPQALMQCVGELERFLGGQPPGMPLLLRAAIGHVQFETIQPFARGNGPLARALILLLLCGEGALSRPLLCPSIYFKRHLGARNDLMRRAREESDWEAWVHFFLAGLLESAGQGAEAIQAAARLFEADRGRIASLGRAAESALRVHELLKKRPVISITPAARELGLTRPTVAASLGHLAALGIVAETTGKARDRQYEYTEYVRILAEGT